MAWNVLSDESRNIDKLRLIYMMITQKINQDFPLNSLNNVCTPKRMNCSMNFYHSSTLPNTLLRCLNMQVAWNTHYRTINYGKKIPFSPRNLPLSFVSKQNNKNKAKLFSRYCSITAVPPLFLRQLGKPSPMMIQDVWRNIAKIIPLLVFQNIPITYPIFSK